MPPVPTIGGGSAVGPNIGIVVTMNTAGASAGFQQLTTNLNSVTQNITQKVTPAFNALRSAMEVLSVGVIVELGKKFIDIAANMERMQTAMSILEGSTAAAGQSLDQLLNIAAKAPFSLGAITDAFLKIKTGGFEQPIEMVQTLADAVASFGGSEQKFKNAAFAIQEIGGKGVVQMKELRRQLGDAIPSAIASMAEGLGISISKLTMEVQKGAITADQGITAMFESFKQHSAGAAELFSKTFLGSIRQLETQFNSLALSFNKGGGLDVLTAAIVLITDKVKELSEYLASAAGQTALSDFFSNIVAHAPDFQNMVTAAEKLVQVVGSITSAVLSALPPEIAGAGLLGYIFFGKKGFIAAIIIDEFSGVIEAIAKTIATLLDGIKSLIGEQATEYGIIGFLLFGKSGIKAAIAGITDAVATMGIAVSGVVAGMIAGTAAAIYGLVQGTKQAVDANTRIRNGGTPDYYEPMSGTPVFGPDNKTGLPPGASGIAQTGDEAAAATPKVETFSSKLQDTIATIRAARAEMEGRFSQPNKPFDLTQEQTKSVEKLAELQQQVQVKIDQMTQGGNSNVHFLGEMDTKMKGVKETLSQLGKEYDEALGKGQADKAAAIKKNIDDINASVAAFRGQLGQVATLNNQSLGAKLNDQLNSLNAQIAAKSPGATGKFDPEQAGVVAARPFAEYQKTLDSLRTETKGFIGDQAAQSAMTDRLNAAQSSLNTTMDAAIARAKADAAEKQRALEIQQQSELHSVAAKADELSGIATLNATQTAVAKVSQEYQKLYDDLAKLRNANPGNDALLAQIDGVQAKLDATEDRAIQKAKNDTDGTSKLWADVGKSIDTGLAAGFEALVTRTKSAKEVLTNFYNDITNAVMKYLEQQAMIGLFGGSGGTGATLSGLFAGAGSPGGNAAASGGSGLVGTLGTWIGGLFAGGAANGGIFPGGVRMFANGGIIGGPTMFGIAGEAGTEAIMPLEKVGGKLGVRTTGGGGGDAYHIQIQALDGPSVRDLFYKEADGLVGALQSRQRLNKSGRTM